VCQYLENILTGSVKRAGGEGEAREMEGWGKRRKRR
jgi:hypothetical protein